MSSAAHEAGIFPSIQRWQLQKACECGRCGIACMVSLGRIGHHHYEMAHLHEVLAGKQGAVGRR